VAKAFETGDVSAIDSVVADDFVDHTDRGDKVGRDSLKAMVNMVRTNFKDMKMETIRELADDEYTFQWMHYTGTSDGLMMPAGPFDMHGMEITKFRDGKAVEHWAYMDVAEMMKMMGQQGAPPPPPMDTTKAK
jgi:predicted SnoaL-like aldol condensation-catalyzing enzyme